MSLQRRSIRLENYNYSMSGAYFITIVTSKRVHLFGEILRSEMDLNSLGQIVLNQWLKSAEIRREIEIDEFIIMPNHFHGIVVIQNDLATDHPGDRPVAPTGQTLPVGPQKASLGALIAGFKTACTTEINHMRNTPKSPVWQRNYYERVIRNQRELDAFREYIQNNPLSWQEDPENQ